MARSEARRPVSDNVRNSSYAIYSRDSDKLTDALTHTAGGRQIRHKRRETNLYATSVATADASFGKLTWQATAEYQLNPEVLFHAKVTTGYLLGSVSIEWPVDREEPILCQLGMKGQFFSD